MFSQSVFSLVFPFITYVYDTTRASTNAEENLESGILSWLYIPLEEVRHIHIKPLLIFAHSDEGWLGSEMAQVLRGLLMCSWSRRESAFNMWLII